MTHESITASLEGMRARVLNGICLLEEYDYKSHDFAAVETCPWPMSHAAAKRWLATWNQFDGLRALRLLTNS